MLYSDKNKKYSYDQLRLVTSKTRNKWYNKQITAVCKNKVCMDIGTGSGILSLMAIEGGAKHVYMIDRVPLYCAMATQMFETLNIPKDKYTIINSEFTPQLENEQLPKVDVIYSETISGHFFHQDFHRICEILSTSKNKDAILIPNLLTGDFAVFDNHEAVHQRVLTGVKEIDDKYDINTQLVFKTDVEPDQRHAVGRIYEKDLSADLFRICHALKSTYRTILKDVINFDVKNPDMSLKWTKDISELPNGKYGMAFYGSIHAGNSNSLFMPVDCWPTHFYVFNKTTDIMQVKFNESFGDFVISSI